MRRSSGCLCPTEAVPAIREAEKHLKIKRQTLAAEGIPFREPVLPAVAKVYTATASTAGRIAHHRCIEATRLYAAPHPNDRATSRRAVRHPGGAGAPRNDSASSETAPTRPPRTAHEAGSRATSDRWRSTPRCSFLIRAWAMSAVLSPRELRWPDGLRRTNLIDIRAGECRIPWFVMRA